MQYAIGLSIAAVTLLGACAGSNQNCPEASAIGFSLQEAQAIVDRFEERHRGSGSQPVPQPTSAEEVLAILKKDQIDHFASGVTFASTQEGIEAKALHAQIELAWGESQFIVASLLEDEARRNERAIRRHQTRGDSAKLAELNDRNAALSELVSALRKVAAEHVASGAAVAEDIIASKPDVYLGYRVAADYYRLRGDWADFDEMVSKIESTNPDSNGLRFLRAMEAAQRLDDRAAARKHLGDALGKDPEFARAQAHALLLQSSIGGRFSEYEKLKSLNPDHQIVRWAGEAIESAHAEWMEKRGSRDIGPAMAPKGPSGG